MPFELEPPIYKVAELEEMAKSLVETRLELPTAIPVDVDYLLEQEPYVLLDYIPGIKQRFGVVGMVYHEERHCLRVIIDAKVADSVKHQNFYRFTVAEELGHIRLHRKIIEQIVDLDSAAQLYEHPEYETMDRNAKRFAAAILMPCECVLSDAKDLYPQLIKVAGFGDETAIKNHMANLLSKKYQVSQEAMSHRLNEWPIRVYDKIKAAMTERRESLH